MKGKKTVFLSTYRYYIPADYEKFFEDLALEGWHPQNVGHWSSIAMRFIKGKPQKYRYVVDLQAMPKKDYRRTYEEFGWEFVGRMSNAFVWRKEYTDERPESFSDTESLAERNKRFIWAISFSFTVFLLTALVGSVCLAVNLKGLATGQIIQYAVWPLFSYAMAVSLGFIMIRIKKSIR